MPDSSAAAPGSNPSRARRVLAWGAGLVGGLAVLVLAAALVLPRLFTSEQLKGYVVPPLEEATGRQVSIDTIELRVLPWPAIRVAGFRLANAKRYGTKPAELDLGGRYHRSHIRVRSSQVSRVDPDHADRWDKERRLAYVRSWLGEADADLSALLTHRLPVEEAADAYTFLENREDGAIQVAFTYDGD